MLTIEQCYDALTVRQIALLKAMRDGKLQKQARTNDRKTAYKDSAKIRKVLNAKTNAHAVAIALGLGLIQPVQTD